MSAGSARCSSASRASFVTVNRSLDIRSAFPFSFPGRYTSLYVYALKQSYHRCMRVIFVARLSRVFCGWLSLITTKGIPSNVWSVFPYGPYDGGTLKFCRTPFFPWEALLRLGNRSGVSCHRCAPARSRRTARPRKRP